VKKRSMKFDSEVAVVRLLMVLRKLELCRPFEWEYKNKITIFTDG